jgi:hypothetical protein
VGEYRAGAVECGARGDEGTYGRDGVSLGGANRNEGNWKGVHGESCGIVHIAIAAPLGRKRRIHVQPHVIQLSAKSGSDISGYKTKNEDNVNSWGGESDALKYAYQNETWS